jgi:NADPH:quinone reductase-like Zn-dependent oxidoreductase
VRDEERSSDLAGITGVGARAAGPLGRPAHRVAAAKSPTLWIILRLPGHGGRSKVGAMRGIAIDRFGGPETLTLRDDLPDPLVGPDTVLVRSRAAGVNPVDWKVREGRLATRFPHHFPLIPGWDVAGVVAEAGPAVRGFSVGDEVYGYVRRDDVQWGTYAELVPAPERTVAHKPATLSYEEAAAVPLAGLTAYQCLVDVLRVGHHGRVLIHGAGGGVGSFAVQIAKALGATVVGTASPGSHDHLRALGADEVVDHTAGPVSAQLTEKVDAVLDLVGGEALLDAPNQVRSPGPAVVSVIDPDTVRKLGGTYVFVRPDTAELSALAEMVDSGQVRVPVAATFPLGRAADAHRQSETGHTRGKIVLTVP